MGEDSRSLRRESASRVTFAKGEDGCRGQCDTVSELVKPGGSRSLARGSMTEIAAIVLLLGDVGDAFRVGLRGTQTRY